MTTRKLAMTLLALAIVLEVGYYMLLLQPPKEPELTLGILNDDAKMKQLFEDELDDFQHGDERRTRFKYIMGTTVVAGFIIAVSIPNRKI
ncbi:hypothetical protein [Cohnella fermenti]|uniref:Uncharacterized protein n=1 Tax=Cohnella fermenti TaxID=2565925 RepID=A0A4S4C4J6_9BACL|nr:hypothetical protein [Cohnella fermenti]THF82727.1 hypothetical protein E6C55_06605 [Cohnella fermenti]